MSLPQSRTMSSSPTAAASVPVMLVTCVKGCCHNAHKTFFSNLLGTGDAPRSVCHGALPLATTFPLPSSLVSLYLSYVHSAPITGRVIDNRARHYESAIIDGEKETLRTGFCGSEGYPRSSRRITTMTTTMTTTAMKMTTTTTRMTSTRMMTTTTNRVYTREKGCRPLARSLHSDITLPLSPR